MLFTWDINVPKNTTEASPVEQDLPLAHGIIDSVSVTWPPGTAKLGHCQIFHFGTLIFPSREGMDLRGDTFPIAWREYYEMYHEPYVLRVKLWNDDDTYPHKCFIAIAVLPRRAILALAVADAIKGILGMLSPKRIFTRSE